MRVIALKTIKEFWLNYPDSEKPLRAFYGELIRADWQTPNELKEQYGSASILSQKRVIFNIGGNKYRLIIDIEYRLQIAFVVWIGTHQQYDSINANNISYD